MSIAVEMLASIGREDSIHVPSHPSPKIRAAIDMLITSFLQKIEFQDMLDVIHYRLYITSFHGDGFPFPANHSKLSAEAIHQ